ncbi:hypothetical protein AAEX63_06680 [Luteococcus sp. H138]|uniref:hypothetical protein n=1 Tax=unclassified Luteococcus TaxID=2639923 RepID=UPI00313EF920
MRTTVTLDEDVVLLLQREMEVRRMKFKDVLNGALREQLGGGGDDEVPLAFPMRDLGPCAVDLTHANQLADELDSLERAHALELGR